MVMHARKTQRANDGYFEKHQSHPYQNSKYSSSKGFGSSAERYERIRDSPNGNYRSDSPDSQSPRDRERSYQSKSSYLQKIREKERENRDYKLSRDKYSDCRSPKDKRSRESEHRTNHDRSEDKSVAHSGIKSQGLSSRDRKPVHNNCVDKRDDRERVPRVGDWSEHISSSGKKYYYNCKTEVSQWEKPREWIDRERERERDRERERERDRERDRERFRTRDRDRDFDRSYGSSSSRSGTRHDKHSNSRGSNGNSNGGKDLSRGSGDVSSGGGTSSSGNRHWGGGSGRDDNVDGSGRTTATRKYSDDAVQSTQDMDISPGDSTPTSELSYGHHHHHHHHQQQQPGIGAIVVSSDQQQQQGGSNVATTSMVVGPVLLAAALPRLVSHPPLVVPPPHHHSSHHAHHHQQQQHLPTTPTSRPEASPLYNPQTTTPTMTAVPLPQSMVTSNAPGQPPGIASLPRMMSQQGVIGLVVGGTVIGSSSSSTAMTTDAIVSSSPAMAGDASSDPIAANNKGLLPQNVHNSTVVLTRHHNASIASSSSSVDSGGTTTTTTQQSHGGLQPLTVDVVVLNQGGAGLSVVAVGDGPPTPTHSESLDCGKATVVTAAALSSPPGSSLSSLQSVSSSLQVLRPQGPTLTPSLANYYRDDLVNHVRGWPAEILEKQADKLAQEAFVMSSIQCAKVSAELKSARSIVRLTEIQATLQEQRILFLRQQIKMLEEMKSQNSFMSDDS